MHEHPKGPAIYSRCACDHCVYRRKQLHLAAIEARSGAVICDSMRSLAEQVYGDANCSSIDRKLAGEVLFPQSHRRGKTHLRATLTPEATKLLRLKLEDHI